jgi:hypothetical protein
MYNMNVYIFGQKMRLEILMLICLVLGGLIYSMVYGCNREGFGPGAALNYSMGTGVKSSWEKPRNQKRGSYMNKLEANVGGPIPLPANELLIFKENKFSPECCPSTYSNSMGCVCASSEQMQYLNERGGNRTLTSEY